MTCFAHELNNKGRVLCDEDIDDICLLTQLLPQDPGRTAFVVDVGAGRGVTSLAVLAGRPRDIIIWAIDHTRDLLKQRTAAVIEAAGYSHRWIPLVQKSDDTEFWASLKLEADMVLIDADHEYESVRNDLAAWLPLAAEGAIFWLHDYADPKDFGFSEINEPTPGVKQAIEEVENILERIPITGMGWAGRKVSHDDTPGQSA